MLENKPVKMINALDDKFLGKRCLRGRYFRARTSRRTTEPITASCANKLSVFPSIRPLQTIYLSSTNK